MSKTAGGVAAAVLLVVTAAMAPVLMSDQEAPAAEASGGSGILNSNVVPAPYRAAVVAAGRRCEGITAPVIAAQIQAESGWNPAAVSPAGAQGIAQFMPGTWATWGADYSGDGSIDVFDAEDAIGSQADFMCHLYSWATAEVKAGAIKGDVLQLALAAYNAGSGAVQSASGMPAIDETRSYVSKILAGVATFSLGDPAKDYAAGGGPAVSADGTYRESVVGSGRLDRSTLCQIPWAANGKVLRCDAEAALVSLDAAFRQQFGEELLITDAYRDYASQVATKASKGHLAAEPGYSNHGWGLAVDVGNIGAEGSTRNAWLTDHAPAYGWQHPSWARVGGSKPEAWHWEFVGTEGQ